VGEKNDGVDAPRWGGGVSKKKISKLGVSGKVGKTWVRYRQGMPKGEN